MPIIRTVTGDISPFELGITHAHEHTVILPGKSSQLHPALLIDSPEKTIAELLDYKQAGGNAVVDAQPIGVERSPKWMREISRRTGIRIIAATGFHRSCFYPDDHFLWHDSAEQLASRIEHEINIGMIEDAIGEQTDIRAGVIKFTSEYHFIPRIEQKAAEAAAIAHQKTGIPILTHTELGTCALEQIQLAETHGVSPSAMILCHLDRNPDRFLHKEIASTGAFLVYDGIARTKYWPDSVIIDLILEMVDAGYEKQIMLAMDVIRTTYTHYGGGPGLNYLLTRFIPRLQKAGVTKQNTDCFLIHNPSLAYGRKELQTTITQ